MTMYLWQYLKQFSSSLASVKAVNLLRSKELSKHLLPFWAHGECDLQSEQGLGCSSNCQSSLEIRSLDSVNNTNLALIWRNKFFSLSTTSWRRNKIFLDLRAKQERGYLISFEDKCRSNLSSDLAMKELHRERRLKTHTYLEQQILLF